MMAGEFYRLLRYRVPLAWLEHDTRLRLFRAVGGEVFWLSRWQLLRCYFAVGVREPAVADLARRGLSPALRPEAAVTQTFRYVRQQKRRSRTLTWLLPGQAAYLPFLDCKGFAVLLKAVLAHRGVGSEFWIGRRLHEGGVHVHAWLVVPVAGGRWVCDQQLEHPLPENEFLERTAWRACMNLGI